METLTLQIPEPLYQRLLITASATQQTLETVVLRSLQVGCPPTWDDIPEPFQVDIAALDKLDDNTLWQIARSHKTPVEMARYNQLLERNQEDMLTETERVELEQLRHETDRWMLMLAQAAALLRWRGHLVALS